MRELLSYILKEYVPSKPIVIGFALMAVGYLLFILSLSWNSTESVAERMMKLLTPRNIGFACFGVGMSIVYFNLLKKRFKLRRSFSDIDEERKTRENMPRSEDTARLISELRSLKHSTAIDYGRIEEVITKAQRRVEAVPANVRSFEEYFGNLVTNLSSRALDSDEKASLLLERGIFYVRFGMIYYFIAIMSWQTLVHFNGFKPEYIYGIASTSLLFLFIEFLSAWFLKQYQHFVDTATYLIKVKAIFDRYYLMYLALKGAQDNIASDEKKLRTLTSALGEDIKWPSENHLTKADVAFAREALDSVTGLFNALKATRKEKKEEDAALV